jgi:hypothetical protein
MSLFRRESLHEKLAREGGLTPQGSEDRRAPWDKAGIHGGNRPREWDEVTSVETNLPGDQATFVVLDDEIVIDEGPDDVEPLVEALRLKPPYRAEAVRQNERVWAVAARRIEVAELPGQDGDELEQTRTGDELTLVVDGQRRFGSIAALDGRRDYAVHATRLEGVRWEVERSVL